ncbi:MAG: substrate-binding domain-containing protein [Deltaproteobacteria bacterium]|nr:substrate-binding domain-containing protein [Deltaproteobacteria bacterium]
MRWLAVAALVCACACARGGDEPARPAPATIRVAIVGGMSDTGFWPALQQRYEALTGHTIEVAASGPKKLVVAAFRKGGIDLIAVHASDAMINLVADGLAVNPQPWLRNDLVIVGPTADPAGVRGEKDAAVALKKIIDAKAPLLVHASHGADGVLHDLREEAKLALDPSSTIFFNEDNQHALLERARAAGAYTLVGRIPMLTKKLHADGMEVLVRGDPRLRRPYLVETSPTAGDAARDLAAWLRSPDTQQWIATFGAGKYDDQPLFFPVAVR